MQTTSTTTYRCVIGFDYEPKRGKALRFEPGTSVAGLPPRVMKELFDQGAIVSDASAAESTDG